MLLDRRKIKKWAKWVALVLAIIFAVSFVAMGVGQGGGSYNVLETFTCSGHKTSAQTQTDQQTIDQFKAKLAANPKDTDALLGLANLYNTMYQDGKGDGTEYLKDSASYLEQVIAVDPTQKDIYTRLANIYMSDDLQDWNSAVAVLNKAVSVDPSNATVYLLLGVAQNHLGNTSATVMAWQKYLQLAPNGDQAAVVKAEIEKLSGTTTTTKAKTTTTTRATTTTTAKATTTSTTTFGLGSTTTSAAQ